MRSPCISASCSERPTAWPCAARNVLAIAPPITSTFTLLDQVAEQVELGGHLGAADHGGNRAHRDCRAPRPAPRVRPASGGRHRPAAGARRPRCWRARGARRRTRRSRRRRPVSPDRPAKAGSFFSSSAWKRVFSSTSTSPRRHAVDRLLGRRRRRSPRRSAPAGRARRPAPSAIGASDISGTRLPFGRSKWLHTMTFAPLPTSSRMVGVSRSIRVRSLILPSRTGTLRSARSSTRLPADVDVVEGAKGHGRDPDVCRLQGRGLARPTRRLHRSCRGRPLDGRHRAGHDVLLDYRLPNSAAVSDMRLEKPHSLSYQPITRASAPSTTAVCVASNVHDAGQWLKSMLTSGAVL